MINQATENVFPASHHKNLTDLVFAFLNVFRISFTSTPARVKPLSVDLIPEARQIRVKNRNFTPEQRNFMAKLMVELRAANMFYPNTSSKWESSPLLVPKPGTDKWRFTVDLCPVNRFTIQHHFPMPILQHELTKIAGSTLFVNLDLSHGYWQLPLDEKSQECQSFITPDGIFTPTRVLHGTTNAVTHLEATINDILSPFLK